MKINISSFNNTLISLNNIKLFFFIDFKDSFISIIIIYLKKKFINFNNILRRFINLILENYNKKIEI